MLFDTRAKSFLPPNPRKHISAALRRSAVSSGSAEPRVFFAGEEHTHPMHHKMQYELIKAVKELDDAPLAIGLEMFYRQHQPALDAFVFGDGDFAKLKRRTQWASTWGYDLNYYSKILAYARRERIRLVGLNAPYRLVAMVANNGLGNLPSELQPFLPEMDLKNEQHYKRFETAMMAAGHGHSGGEAMMETQNMRRSYEAMTLWDEYMAASIAGYLRSPVPEPMMKAGKAGGGAVATAPSTAVAPAAAASDPNWRMVVLVGTDHVRGRVGVPDRVTRRTGLSTFTMVPLSVPWADSGQPAIDRPLGDSEGEWLLYTQPRIDEQTRRAAAGRTMMWPSTASMVSVRSLSDPRGPKERVSYTALASTPVEI